jgi:hypothetical protein
MSSKETKNKSRLCLSALLLLAATAVLSTVTTTGNNVFAQDDSEENGNGNSDNEADNGNGNAETETETAAEEEDTRGSTPGGMGNCNNSPDDCQPQKDRVGNDDDTDTDADRDGPGGEGGSAGDLGQGEDDGKGEANCWGKVSSALGQQENEREGPAHASDPAPDPGDEDQSPNELDRETPREGVGNQQEGHPSDHADTVGGFVGADTPDCVD